MKHFRDLDLSSYSLSSVSGFLPERPALERLPNPYYDHWEDLSRNLPQLVASDTLKDKLERLPILSTALLDSEEEWRRAYVVLSFLSQGYIWSGDQPRRVSTVKLVIVLTSHGLFEGTDNETEESSDSNRCPSQKGVRISHHHAMRDLRGILSLERYPQSKIWKSTNQP